MLYLSLLPPPLAVGSVRSSCCSRFVCFCAFFPLTHTVTPSASLLLVLFLFLPPAALMSPSLPLPCCGRRLSSVYGWFVAGLPSSSGHPVLGYCFSVWCLGRFSVAFSVWAMPVLMFHPFSFLLVHLACRRLLLRCLRASYHALSGVWMALWVI